MGGDNVSVAAPALPNITGKIGPIDYSGSTAYVGGAFYADGSTSYGATSSGARRFISFAASRCSSIYGNSDTVMPPSILLIPQIKY